MLKQIIAVTSINLRSFRNRIGMSSVIIISVAAVIGVLLSLLALRAGVDQAASNNASPRNAMLVDAKSGQGIGDFSAAQVPIIGDLPGVAHDAQGNPLISTAAIAQLTVRRKNSGILANAQIIGVNSESFEMDPHFHLIAGRMFHPGVRELIVGQSAQVQYVGMDIGDHIHSRGADWTITGVFTDNGAAAEGNLQGDVDTVMSETRQTSFSNVLVQLDSAADFPGFKEALNKNRALGLDAQRETDWLHDQLRTFDNLLSSIGYFVAGIMAVGAISAALNVMYAAVDRRKLEIATLRAIGFGGTAVAASVMIETLLIAFPGACLGALIAYLCFNGHVTQTEGLIFHLAITPGLIKLAFIWTVVIALIAGLPPAIHAARMPIATAIRAS